MSRQEGYIKFDCRWTEAPPLPEAEIAELNSWRAELWRAKLIGVYPDGVGYGNISRRSAAGSNAFVISASQTGALPDLAAAQYSLVTEFDAAGNWLRCEGPMRASSESLTHAAAYAANPEVMAVMHAHDIALWLHLLDEGDATPIEAEYGTPEMAAAIGRLAAGKDCRIVAMTGHPEGVISFGPSLAHAGDILFQARRAIGLT